jgi:hypothetical protein
MRGVIYKTAAVFFRSRSGIEDSIFSRRVNVFFQDGKSDILTVSWFKNR